MTLITKNVFVFPVYKTSFWFYLTHPRTTYYRCLRSLMPVSEALLEFTTQKTGMNQFFTDSIHLSKEAHQAAHSFWQQLLMRLLLTFATKSTMTKPAGSIQGLLSWPISSECQIPISEHWSGFT